MTRWMLPLLLPLGLLTSSAHAQDRGARGDDAAFVQDADSEDYDPGARDRFIYSNATFGRLNPLGLIDTFRIGWRRRLSTKDSLLLRDTYAFVGGSAMVTPAFTRVGVSAEAQLLAVLRVFADVSGVGYYGSFDQVLSWDDPGAVYSDNTLSLLGEQGRNSPTTGWVFTTGATVRAAAGPVALRSTVQFTRFDLDLPDGDVVFYDQFWDRLAPDGGWMALNDLDLLVLSGPARVGARYTATAQLGGRTEGADGSMGNHRVGPLFAWQFTDKPKGARFNQATAFVLAQWWVKHPYRTGAEQPAGLPLIAFGFAFNGDLLGERGAR